MPGMEQELLPLALLALDLHRPAAHRTTGEPDPGRPTPGRADGKIGAPVPDRGPYEPWTRPLLLLDAGRREEAAAALAVVPEPPHDLLYEARLCLLAHAALALGDVTTMEWVYTGLLPAADELAGAGSGVLTLGPVAGYLGDLAAALGRPMEAVTHHEKARKQTKTAHTQPLHLPPPHS
jgi:hypothetical protein